MSILDEIDQVAAKTKRSGCKVCLFLEQQPADVRADFERGLATPKETRPHTAVAQVMTKYNAKTSGIATGQAIPENLVIKGEAVAAHRRDHMATVTA